MPSKHKIAKRKAAKQAAEAKRQAKIEARQAAHKAREKEAQEESEAAREAKRVEVARRLAKEAAKEAAKVEAERAEMEAKAAAEQEAANAAREAKRVEVVRRLAEEAAKVEAEQEAALLELNKQLMLAARHGNYLKARQALENGADATYVNDAGETVLSLAVQSHDVMLVTLIADAGGDVTQLTSEGDNLLSVALSTYFDESQKTNCAKVIYKLKKIYKLDPSHKNNMGESFLDQTTTLGLDDWYRDLGAAVIVEQIHNQQIIEAAKEQAIQVIRSELSISEGGSLEGSVPIETMNALVMQVVIQKNQFDALKTLVESGYPIQYNHVGHSEPIHVAAEEGRVEIIEYLYQYGADLDAPGRGGSKALHSAAEFGHMNAIRTLVKLGADINSTSNNGATPLYIAAENGAMGVVRCLVEECGADPHLSCTLETRGTTLIGIEISCLRPITPRDIAANNSICNYLSRAEKGEIPCTGLKAIDITEDHSTKDGAGAFTVATGSLIHSEGAAAGAGGAGAGSRITDNEDVAGVGGHSVHCDNGSGGASAAGFACYTLNVVGAMPSDADAS